MSTSCNKVRTFLLILNEYVPIIDHTPDISTIICNTLHQLRDALISHETALNELDILKNNETIPINNYHYLNLQIEVYK